MIRKRGGIGIFTVLCAGSIFFAIAAGAGQDHDAEHKHGSKEQRHTHEHATSAASENSGNPLIEEMHILDGVIREVVSAVSLGDGQRVCNALHSMHGAMEKTHEGVHHGTVKITKNADKLTTFVKMDKDFHGELEKLASAAKTNDQTAMLNTTKGLLDGCVKCHGMFR